MIPYFIYFCNIWIFEQINQIVQIDETRAGNIFMGVLNVIVFRFPIYIYKNQVLWVISVIWAFWAFKNRNDKLRYCN